MLGIRPLLIWHLPLFGSALAKFELADVSGLVSVADKAKRVNFAFDLTSTRHFTLLRKFLDCIRIPSLRAFDHRLALLAPPIGSEVC